MALNLALSGVVTSIPSCLSCSIWSASPSRTVFLIQSPARLLSSFTIFCCSGVSLSQTFWLITCTIVL